jgi:hypothetical protein
MQVVVGDRKRLMRANPSLTHRGLSTCLRWLRKVLPSRRSQRHLLQDRHRRAGTHRGLMMSLERKLDAIFDVTATTGRREGEEVRATDSTTSLAATAASETVGGARREPIIRRRANRYRSAAAAAAPAAHGGVSRSARRRRRRQPSSRRHQVECVTFLIAFLVVYGRHALG